ncbi:MAG: cobalt transporter [Lachnospiraceae bacterium]|nr:cobalt transporter [Lachnospiraceae bacterium]MDD3797531.1 cobalt transporter [Lachnospiraceae bacterium]
MHLIEDENGNLCSHSHEHEHTHTHSYEHSHPHSHEHGQEENHTHTHGNEGCASCASGCEGHSHNDSAPASADQTTALLDYMLKHNEHHAAELDQMAAKLQAAGKNAAAEQIKKAVDEFQKGNLYLGLALATVKEDR